MWVLPAAFAQAVVARISAAMAGEHAQCVNRTSLACPRSCKSARGKEPKMSRDERSQVRRQVRPGALVLAALIACTSAGAALADPIGFWRASGWGAISLRACVVD